MDDIQQLRRLAKEAATECDHEEDWFCTDLIESDELISSSRKARRFIAAMTPHMAMRLIVLADRAAGVKACGNTPYDEGPFTLAENSEALVLAIRDHLDGWSSATFGCQGDPDPMIAERNKGAAIQAHAAECLRRIRETLGAGVRDDR